MTFQGAVIREQGITFAVVIVKKHVIDSGDEAGQAIAASIRSSPACRSC